MSSFSFKKAEHLGNHKKHKWFLLKSFEEKLLFSKLKENKTSLRSCSGEIQGQVLGAIGDRVKAQGQHNAAIGKYKYKYKYKYMVKAQGQHNAVIGKHKNKS